MSLGFQEEFSLSGYTREEFIEMWDESSSMANELLEYLLASFDARKVILPGETTELIRYIRGVLFIMGFSEADMGSLPDLYDNYVSDSVAKAKAVIRELRFGKDTSDSINQEFIMNLSDIFKIKDETKLYGLWRILNSSAVAAAKPQKGSGIRYSGRTSTGLAVTIPPSSVQKGSNVTKGKNYPLDDRDASLSVQYSLSRDGEKRLSENFKVADFRCKDGSDVILINPKLIEVLEKIRSHFGKPVNIVSGYRTPSYNRTLKGAAKNSQHMYGNAADIVINGVSPKEIYDWVSEWHKGGMGLYGSFTHIDVRDSIGKPIAKWGEGERRADIA